MRISPIAFLLTLLASCFLHGTVSAQSYTYQYNAPIIVQDGFGVGGGKLPGDGLEYCIPTSTTMAMLYMPQINPAFGQFVPTNHTTANLLNFDRVLGGLMGTTPSGGTSSAINGVATYLATQGLGTATISSDGNTATSAYFTYSWVGEQTVPQMLQVFQNNGTYQNANVATVSTIVIGWYGENSDGTYSRDGGHGLTLTAASVNGSGVYTPGSSMIGLINPEPSTLLQSADLSNYASQILNTSTPQTFTVTYNGGSYSLTEPWLLPGNGVYINGTLLNGNVYANTAVGLDGQYILTVNKSLPSGSGLLPWQLSGTFPITTNNGTLSVPTTVTDGTSSGGLFQFGLGTLTLANAVTTTGAFTLSGGTLISTANPTVVGSNAILGSGTLNLDFGTLSISPSGSGSSAAINLAGGSGNAVIYGGGAVLAIDPGSFGTLQVTLGGLVRSGTIVGSDPPPTTGTLAVAAASGNASLGTTVKVVVAGGLNTTNGMVSPTIVAQDTSANQSAGDFLAYSPATGLVVAAYTASTSTPIASTTSSTVYSVTDSQSVATGGNATVYALKVGPSASVGGGANSKLNVGPQSSGSQAGMILNGGSITVPTLQLGESEGVVYTGAAGGTISSAISTSGGLTSFGPGMLVLAGDNANISGAVTVQSGTLAINTGGTLPATAAVTVNSGATLSISGTVAGNVTALDVAAQNITSSSGSTIYTQNGGIVRMAGGTITGLLSVDRSSALQGGGTISGSASIKGSIAAGPAPAGGWTVANPANLNFTGSATLTNAAFLTWSLFTPLDSSNGTAGMNWNTISFTGSNTGKVEALTVLVDLSNLPSDPNSGNSFWNQSHSWLLIAPAANTTVSDYVYVSVASYEQGTFGGRLLFQDDGYYIVYTPVPEPTVSLAVVMGALLLGRRGFRRS